MVHIVSITKARNTLPFLIKQVVATKQPVVIVRESVPSAILYPYTTDTHNSNESYQEKLLSISGDWFSEVEQKKIRDEVEKRLA